MSGWLCSTKKLLARAITSIAEELEITANDLNDAIQSMSVSGEEQLLYASHISNPGSTDLRRSCATMTMTQQPQKSSLLPAQVVPGDLVVEQHFSQPKSDPIRELLQQLAADEKDGSLQHFPQLEPALNRTQQPQQGEEGLRSLFQSQATSGRSLQQPDQTGEQKEIDEHAQKKQLQQLSPKAEVMCRTTGDEEEDANLCCTPSPPTPVVTKNHCQVSSKRDVRLGDKRPGRVVRTSSSDLCDLDLPETGKCNNSEEKSNDDTVTDCTEESRSNTGAGSRLRGEDLPPNWLGPFSYAMTLAYTHVANTLNTIMAEIDGQESESRKQLGLRPPDSDNTFDTSIRGGPESPRPVLTSSPSIRSTYSSESFEIIEPSMFNSFLSLNTTPECDRHVSDEATRPVFVVGDDIPELSNGVSSKPESESVHSNTLEVETTSASAELINFNFRDLISGLRLPGASSAQESRATVVETSCVPSNPDTSSWSVVSDDDDGSSSFDVLSDPGEEEFIPS